MCGWVRSCVVGGITWTTIKLGCNELGRATHLWWVSSTQLSNSRLQGTQPLLHLLQSYGGKDSGIIWLPMATVSSVEINSCYFLVKLLT